jgi:hypothetical protein
MQKIRQMKFSAIRGFRSRREIDDQRSGSIHPPLASGLFSNAEHSRKNGTGRAQGCQILLGTTYQNGGKYTKLLQKYTYAPNVHKIYQHLPLQNPQKFTQNLDFWFEHTFCTIWQPC